MRMLPGLHEPKSPVASSEGIRVVIHPPDTEPFPFAEGFDVPPGFSVSFGIRPRKNLRIKAPYGKLVYGTSTVITVPVQILLTLCGIINHIYSVSITFIITTIISPLSNILNYPGNCNLPDIQNHLDILNQSDTINTIYIFN